MENIDVHIIKAATEQFKQYGIRSVSIDDICNQLRISKKTFYRYFPKKENLVEAVVVNSNEELKENFFKLIKGKNAVDSLIVVIKELRNYSKQDEYKAFFFDFEKYYPKIYMRFKETKSLWVRNNFEKVLRQGIEEGYFREDLDVELSAVFHAMQTRHSFREVQALAPKVTQRRIFDFYIDMIVRLIANEKGLDYIEKEIKQ